VLLLDKPINLPNAEDPLEALSIVAYDHGWICYVEQLRWLSDFFTTSKGDRAGNKAQERKD
jgi:hypothetical protein